MAESVVFILLLEILPAHNSRDIYKQTGSECLALSLVLKRANDTQQETAALELSIVLKADLLDDSVFPLARASV